MKLSMPDTKYCLNTTTGTKFAETYCFSDPKVLLETPKRIFGRIDKSSVCLCDYAFPDERVFESKERFKDLADLMLKEDELEVACEKLPSK